MSNITFSTKVTWAKESVRSVADVNGKQVIVDEPVSLGGTDLGPNPIEYLLTALGGCMNVLITSFAEQHGVILNESKVYVEGDLDPDGFLEKNKNIRTGLQIVRYRIEIDSPSPTKNVEELIAHVERVCPVKNTLTGVPMVALTNAALNNH